MTNTLLYKVWQMMKDRCNNPKAQSYKYYGGRGITVCPEWERSSATFLKWAISHGYKQGLSIDRKDNNGDYEPSNCRFVTSRSNLRNNSWTKLCFEIVVKIKELLTEDKLNNREIGEMFGVSHAVISRIRTNTNWKDVPWPCESTSKSCKK